MENKRLDMKTRYKPPVKKKFLHTRRKIDKINITLKKKKNDTINQKNYKMNL